MSLVATYPMQGGQLAHSRDKAVRRGIALPWGGPTGAGGDYVALAPCCPAFAPTAQPEKWTVAVSAGGGTFNLQFGSNAIQSTGPLPWNVSLVAFNTALNTIFPTWMLPAGSVTGTPGSSYLITFGVNARIGGLTQFINALTGGAGTVTLTRTQRGSVGPGQYDLFDGVTNTQVGAFLVDQIGLGPTGALSTTPFGPPTDATFSPVAWQEGFFFGADLAAAGLTDAGVASSPNLAFVGGATSLASPGCVVRMLQG